MSLLKDSDDDNADISETTDPKLALDHLKLLYELHKVDFSEHD